MMTRRNAIAMGAAAAAVTAIAPAAVAMPPVPPPRSWIIGTPGEYDWVHCWGDTEHEAKLDWLVSHVGDCECEHGHTVPGEDCDCEACSNYKGADSERVEAWDGKTAPEIGPGDWIRAGLGHVCSRCGYETDPDDGHGVGREAVCGDCMKLADWEIVDPERAAEMRADLEAEG